MKTTELKDRLDFSIHGNKARSPMAALQARFGNKITTVCVGEKCGTVMVGGECWDWFISDHTGDVIIEKAR